MRHFIHMNRYGLRVGYPLEQCFVFLVLPKWSIGMGRDDYGRFVHLGLVSLSWWKRLSPISQTEDLVA